MRITTDREKHKLYSSDEYKTMLSEKGRMQANWNWQTRELQAQKSRLNNSQIVQGSIQTGGTQNGIEMLDSSFSEAQSLDDKIPEPMEVQIMKVD